MCCKADDPWRWTETFSLLDKPEPLTEDEELDLINGTPQ